MGTNKPSKSSCAGCGAPLLERNRYYTGKFMTARDFQGEQDYLRSRSQLHNRLLHGWGVVAGLDVVPNSILECRSSTVIVKAGAALDCCGREVILNEDMVFEVPRTGSSGSQPVAGQSSKEERQATREELLLCLYYSEEKIELTPAIYSDGSCETEADQANRIREGATLRLVHLDEVEAGCWQGGREPTRCREDCDDPIPGPAGIVLEPNCPCGLGIPLALLSFDRDRNDDPIVMDGRGRRRLPVNADMLTHIVQTNWRHGEIMSINHLREKLRGRLEIRFDRKIRQQTDDLGVGVSEFTFFVRFGGIHDDLRHLPYSREYPPTLEDECVAVFHIDPAYLDTKRRDDLKDKVIYVSLKCDFVPDCRGLPVDGAFLGATLPTHGGRMGGTFESWFSIAESDAEARERSAASRESVGRRSKPRKEDEQ